MPVLAIPQPQQEGEENSPATFELSAPKVVRESENPSVRNFPDCLAQFSAFGERTITESLDGIPYFINSFWTSSQRKAHSLHEISYRACFKAQLPAFFISRLTERGDSVLDPFMGRGTTLVQAAIMRRHAMGNDINPLSVFLARPRLREVNIQRVAEALSEVDWEENEGDPAPSPDKALGLDAFYHPRTLAKLQALRRWIAAHGPLHADPGQTCDWIRMVALNRLSGHSPGFFSGRSMPPNQAVSAASQQRINTSLGVKPPEKDVPALILRKTRSLLRNGSAPAGSAWLLQTGPAWDLAFAPDSTVDLVVTSPPFLDTVDYETDNWLRCWFAGIDPDDVAIDMHRSEEKWSAMVRRTLTELARVVRPGGHVAFEVGEVRKGQVLLERLVWRAAAGLPFSRLCVIVNRQEFTKTSHTWGVANGRFGTNTNRIVVLRRL